MHNKEEFKCIKIIKQKKWLTMMLLQTKTWKNNESNIPQIPDHSYRILIIGSFISGKTNIT